MRAGAGSGAATRTVRGSARAHGLHEVGTVDRASGRRREVLAEEDAGEFANEVLEVRHNATGAGAKAEAFTRAVKHERKSTGSRSDRTGRLRDPQQAMWEPVSCLPTA